MIYLSKCSIDNIQKNDFIKENHPINLNLCKTLYKSIYQNHEHNFNKPSIIFEMIGEQQHYSIIQWIYNTVEERDIDYHRLIKPIE